MLGNGGVYVEILINYTRFILFSWFHYERLQHWIEIVSGFCEGLQSIIQKRHFQTFFQKIMQIFEFSGLYLIVDTWTKWTWQLFYEEVYFNKYCNNHEAWLKCRFVLIKCGEAMSTLSLWLIRLGEWSDFHLYSAISECQLFLYIESIQVLFWVQWWLYFFFSSAIVID